MSRSDNRAIVKLMHSALKEAHRLVDSELAKADTSEDDRPTPGRITTLKRLKRGLDTSTPCGKTSVVLVLSPLEANLLSDMVKFTVHDEKALSELMYSGQRLRAANRLVEKVHEAKKNKNV